MHPIRRLLMREDENNLSLLQIIIVYGSKDRPRLILRHYFSGSCREKVLADLRKDGLFPRANELFYYRYFHSKF